MIITQEINVSELLEKDILQGLQNSPKSIPSKYFYDERGSQLFEEICSLDEYYLTRAELEIMHDYSDELASVIGNNSLIIEFGSGSSRKTRLLLEKLEAPAGYIPVDISHDFLISEASKLKKEFPYLHIEPVISDYTQPFKLPEIKADKRIIYFPGSTIGNFTPEEAKQFLFQSTGLLGKIGGLLIGFDLKKDSVELVSAYNDSRGLTAKFNKNILRRLNRELGANFDTGKFRHQAIYNEKKGRIEMHLISLEKQVVTISNTKIEFDLYESIHTENSYKYTIDEFEELISERYTINGLWMDSGKKFCVCYFVLK